MVIEFAKAGGTVFGYEIKEELVKRSRERIKEANLQDKITIYHKSYWEEDLSQYNTIYIYGMTTIIGRLSKKLQAELKPSTKIISNVFCFPNWKVKKVKNNIHLYIVH